MRLQDRVGVKIEKQTETKGNFSENRVKLKSKYWSFMHLIETYMFIIMSSTVEV